MTKLVILRIEEGNFTTGFPVSLRIVEEEGDLTSEIAISGRLPPAQDIPAQYQNWQANYRNLGKNLRLGSIPIQSNVNLKQASHESGIILKDSLNNWLNSSEFQAIREKWLEILQPKQTIRVLLQTDNSLLQRLPWHLWDLLERYPQAEIAIASLVYDSIPSISRKGKVRILAILGHSQDINIERDRLLLSQLPDSKVCFLVEPALQDVSDRLWSEHWDILFFAGHSMSETDTKGRIFLNPTESMTVEQLKKSLTQAVSKGLQLAIFNSCDGLGLARDLAQLQIPHTIFMREPVPDIVAQQFLKYFLTSFTGGKYFYLAVKEARERLEGLETQFPFATWLPVIWQHPAAIVPSWQKWTYYPKKFSQKSLTRALLTSISITSLCLGTRWLGILEPIELWAYDRALRLRPLENPDSRITIVAVTEKNIQEQLKQQNSVKGSISDRNLDKLLAKLETYQPRVIGIDIYHDFPVQPEYPDLSDRFQTSEKIIGLCKVRDADNNPEGIAPPPKIPLERVGFSDFIADDDGILRRQLLFMDPDPLSSCMTPYGLSVQLATRYLAFEEIKPQFTANGNLKLGETIFQSINSHTGGYQGIDSRGSQILLNYRSLASLEQIAPIISLDKVLNDEVNSQLFQDKIILIGVVARSTVDFWTTPYGRGLSRQVPGVIIQAHMTSQIISAVRDNRHLLRSLPEWGESLWLLFWSLIGGLIALFWHSFKSRAIAVIALVIILAITYQLLFLQSLWLPVISSILVLVVTVFICSRFYLLTRKN